MPNSRRRKFSVQNAIGGRSAASESAGSGSLKPTFARPTPELAINPGKSKPKMFPGIPRPSPLEIVAEKVESSSSIQTVITKRITVDKHVTASSSTIDLFNLMNLSAGITEEIPGSSRQKHVNRERTEARRERPRQHRVKVRSPRRRLPELEKMEVPKQTVANDPINWALEMEIFNITSPSVSDPLAVTPTPPLAVTPIPPLAVTSVPPLAATPVPLLAVTPLPPLALTPLPPLVVTPTPPAVVTCPVAVEDRVSEHSLDDMCRICHGGECLSLELGPLISACNCRGTVGRVHVRCLERWLTESGKSRCELCGSRYATRRVHRYGVPRALLMWVLSQNAKQLMVDSLGIMLMSPLAVLAAWLSGRTLAGLMAPDGRAAPWPLASTFVLACMTLVCYYCWIVSAATRHALGWWIWYRSQYEVRLLQDTEEA